MLKDSLHYSYDSNMPNLEMNGYAISLNDTDNWMVRILRSGTFARISSASLQNIFMRMESVSVRAGDIIIKQGDDEVYYTKSMDNCTSRFLL